MRMISSATPRPLNLLAVGPNGLVAAASRTFGAPGDVEVWEGTTGDLVMSFDNPEMACSLALTADGRTVLLSDANRLRYVELSSAGCVTTILFPHSGTEFAQSVDGGGFVVTNTISTSGEVSCYTTVIGDTPRRRWHHADSFVFTRPAFAPTGDRVAVTTFDTRSSRARSSIQVRDVDRGVVCGTVPLDPTSPVRQLVFTADGAKLLVRADSNAVQLFDAATGADLGTLKHKGRPFVTGIAVHPRGPVACARTDGTVTLWDADAREQLRVLDWKAGRLVSVAFAPDGALAAAGTEDGKVIVWDVDL